MKHYVVIDDAAPKGAELLELIKQFPTETVEIVEDDENFDDCVSIDEWAGKLRETVQRKIENKKSE